MYQKHANIPCNAYQQQIGHQIVKPTHRTAYLERRMTDGEWDHVMADECSHNDRYLLNGLHCCGELAPTMIDVFSRLPKCRALLLTSCCYHKMAPGSQPMSALCKQLLGDTALRYVTLEAACHFQSDYRDKLRETAQRGSMELFQSQLFRAAFQEVVARRGAIDKLSRSRIGAGKRCHTDGEDSESDGSMERKFQR